MTQNSKFLFVFLALGLLFSCAQTPQPVVSEKPVVPTADLTSEKIRDSIVLIESENISGTGFFIAPDKIATNTHVVAHAGPVFVKSPDRKKDWTIEGVIGFDAKSGLVILKLAGESKPLPLADRVQIGESISIPGYSDGAFEITEGNIQSIRNSNKWLRLNTTTSKETNGSPVFNNNGQVIGVIVPYGRYAIPSNALAALLNASIPMEPLSEWQQRKPVRAAASYSLGIQKSDAKDYAGALVDFDKAIELDARHANAYRNRGGVKFRLGESESARGNTEAAQRLYEAAIADCDKAIEIDPEDADPYNNRGAAKLALGESVSDRGEVEKARELYKAAVEDYTQVVKINPGDADAYENQATVKCKLGDIESARGDAEKAQRLYHDGITDYDKYIQLNNPEDVNESAADIASEKVKNSTVRVMGWAGDFYSGSGFFVDRDRIATNIHVVAQLGPVFAKLRDKEVIWKVKEVAAFDVASDLVILKIGGEGIPLFLGDSEAVQSGEPVIAVGYPDKKYKVTEGTMDSILNSGKWLRAKVATSGGSSGGPMLNSMEQVIGINAASSSSHSYAIPSSILKTLLGQSSAMEPLAEWQERELIRAYALFVQGLTKHNANQYHEAIADYDKTIKINSQFLYAYYKRGDAKFDLGNYEAAIADWDKAIKIDDAFLNIYFERGRAKFALGNYEAAIADYDRAIQIDPEDADIYSNRGSAKFRLGESENARGDVKKAQSLYEAAIADYDRAIQIDPEDADIYSNRGSAKFRLGESENARGDVKKAQSLYEAAIADYDRAIQIDPEDADIYSNRGGAKSRFGESESASGDVKKAQSLYEAAIKDCTRAIQIDPEHAGAYNNRGLAKKALGRKEAAKADFQKARVLDPDVGK